jgi:hypothetical protein
MNIRIRAKVLIPTLLFVALALPAMLIPIILNTQATASVDATHETAPFDPMEWETDSKTSPTVHQVNPDEIDKYLDSFLGE